VHVQRRDVLLNWLLVALQAWHWFNPFVWWAFRRLRAERELVCDSLVLSRLAGSERRAYGDTLLKLVRYVSPSPLTPAFVPILHRKPEIERRITMIARFRPTSRAATLASAVLLTAILCLTFTRAADPVKPAEVPKNTAVADKAKRERGIRALERELKKLDALIEQKQAETDKLKAELGITEIEAANGPGGTTIEPETLRKMDAQRVEARADYSRMETFCRALTNLSRRDLRQAIATASPDTQLADLFTHLHMAEQKMAGLVEGYGPDHPDVKSTRRLLEKINQQIDERVDGILKGLQVKTEGERARYESLQKEVDRFKQYDIEQAIRRRPYWKAKREMEQLQLLRERIQLRIFQEKLDAAMESEE
jgi:hypothetical protein